MTERIRCEWCSSQCADEGCAYCGNFGFLLSRSQCPECSIEVWDKPGSRTEWDGKAYRSWNGVEMVVRLENGQGVRRCSVCDRKKAR